MDEIRFTKQQTRKIATLYVAKLLTEMDGVAFIEPEGKRADSDILISDEWMDEFVTELHRMGRVFADRYKISVDSIPRVLDQIMEMVEIERYTVTLDEIAL